MPREQGTRLLVMNNTKKLYRDMIVPVFLFVRSSGITLRNV
jgi:hypothetical protein